MCKYTFVTLGINFDYTLKVKVTTVHECTNYASDYSLTTH